MNFDIAGLYYLGILSPNSVCWKVKTLKMVALLSQRPWRTWEAIQKRSSWNLESENKKQTHLSLNPGSATYCV